MLRQAVRRLAGTAALAMGGGAALMVRATITTAALVLGPPRARPLLSHSLRTGPPLRSCAGCQLTG
jgi:hypothetical protein